MYYLFNVLNIVWTKKLKNWTKFVLWGVFHKLFKWLSDTKTSVCSNAARSRKIQQWFDKHKIYIRNLWTSPILLTTITTQITRKRCLFGNKTIKTIISTTITFVSLDWCDIHSVWHLKSRGVIPSPYTLLVRHSHLCTPQAHPLNWRRRWLFIYEDNFDHWPIVCSLFFSCLPFNQADEWRIIILEGAAARVSFFC